MLSSGIITAFSRELLLNCSYHQHIFTWPPPEWMPHIGLWNNCRILLWTLQIAYAALWNHHSILMWTPLNSQYSTMNSSHDVHVNSYWMAHAELRNHHSIFIWTQAEWMAHVELLNCHSILSWTSKWLMLDYEIITAFSHELLLNY